MLRHAVRRWGMGAVVFGLAGAAFHVGHHTAGYWGIDDAGITYGHAVEFADHGSLAAYVEGTPVESFSNPVVFFVVALLRLLGLFDPVTTHHRIEILLFATMVTLVWAVLRRVATDAVAVGGAAVFALLEIATPSTWLWYCSGLENLWVSTGIVAMIWLLVRCAHGDPPTPAWGVIGALTAMTHPEAPVFVAGFYGALLLAKPPDVSLRTHLQRGAASLAVTTLLFGGFLVWRHAHYGDWLPNTYYAKLSNLPLHPLDNVRSMVIGQILPYAWSWVFFGAAVALVFVPSLTRVGRALVVMTLASLALPITAGTDFFFGELRFSTPYLATVHVAFAVFAVWAFGLRDLRVKIAVIAGAVALSALLVIARVRRPPIYCDNVTVARIAELQGGERWEQQMRAGVPYAVTMLPDVGGTILVGGIQLVDDAYLAEYVLAHMGRYWSHGPPELLRQVNQYEHEERRPDLVDPATAVGVYDATYAGTRYLKGVHRLIVRRDLVELDGVPAGVQLLAEADGVRVYASPETVRTAAPGALVRYAVIVVWSGGVPDDSLVLSARVDGGDRDEIPVHPFARDDHGIERRALLLGAPGRRGTALVTVEITRGGKVVSSAAAPPLMITRDLGPAATEIAGASSPLDAARRFAWLREQSIPRFGMSRFHVIERAMLREDLARDPRAGRNVLRLRWEARLATFEDLPRALRDTERAIVHRVVTSACSGSEARIACLGRTVDMLRRFGYLGVVRAEPALADELARARANRNALPPAQRYRVLVGLVLADPADIPLQRELIALRRALTTYPALP